MLFADMHCDTLYEIYKRGVIFCDDSLSVCHSAFPLFEKHIRNYAIYLENGSDNPALLYEGMLKIYNDIKPELEGQGVKPLLSVEGGALAQVGYPIEKMKQDGVSMMSLAWNFDNMLAGGSEGNGGLTRMGAEIIAEMNNCGMALDLSHLNVKSFYGAIEIADNVLATHSCIKEVKNHKRNITLEQAKLIADKKGITGICFYPEFLEENIFDSIYRNIYLMLEAGLEKSIAIGSDFDGGKMNYPLAALSDVPRLYEYLDLKFKDKALLDGIFYTNAKNFADKLLTNSKL